MLRKVLLSGTLLLLAIVIAAIWWRIDGNRMPEFTTLDSIPVPEVNAFDVYLDAANAIEDTAQLTRFEVRADRLDDESYWRRNAAKTYVAETPTALDIAGKEFSEFAFLDRLRIRWHSLWMHKQRLASGTDQVMLAATQAVDQPVFVDGVALLENLPGSPRPVASLRETVFLAWDYAITTKAAGELLLTALALHAHREDTGAYPDRLEALHPNYLPRLTVDPFATHRPLAYQRTSHTYTLYSVGPGGNDLRGTPIPPRDERSPDTRSTRYPEGDLVFGENILAIVEIPTARE